MSKERKKLSAILLSEMKQIIDFGLYFNYGNLENLKKFQKYVRYNRSKTKRLI
jgi:hypothetical protein